MAITAAEKDALRRAVYEIVRTIPYGRATSYGAIARAIGYPGYSRMVGNIMSTCDSANSRIPAHRVVNSQGILSAKAAFGPSDEMNRLLENEGVIVKNNRIRNWRTIFWDPIEEITLQP